MTTRACNSRPTHRPVSARNSGRPRRPIRMRTATAAAASERGRSRVFVRINHTHGECTTHPHDAPRASPCAHASSIAHASLGPTFGVVRAVLWDERRPRHPVCTMHGVDPVHVTIDTQRSGLRYPRSLDLILSPRRRPAPYLLARSLGDSPARRKTRLRTKRTLRFSNSRCFQHR